MFPGNVPGFLSFAHRHAKEFPRSSKGRLVADSFRSSVHSLNSEIFKRRMRRKKLVES